MPGAILKYRKRLSGPLLDRIDLHIDVPPVKEESLDLLSRAEPSSKVRDRVTKARYRQRRKFKSSRIKTNCQLSTEAIDLLKQAISRLSLSARAYFKVIKIAQTIADLGSKEKIEVSHVAEALQYRMKEE